MSKWRLRLNSIKIDAGFALQAGQLIRQGSVVLTGVLLVKWRLSVGEIGVYETALFLGGAMSFFWLGALIQGLTVYYPPLSGERRKTTIWNIFVFCSVASLVLFTVLRLGNDFLLKALTGGSDLRFIQLYLLFLLFNLPASFLEIIFLLDRQPQKQLFYFIWSYGLQTLAIAAPVGLGWSFTNSFYALIVLGVFRYVYLLIYIFIRAGSAVLSLPALKSYLALCLPLIGYSFLSGFASFFDGWWVNFYFHGAPAIFAVFRYGAREFPLSLALSMGLSSAATAALSKDWKSGLPELKRKAANLQRILFPIGMGLILFSKPLFLLVFNRSFSESADLFSIYLLLTLSRVLFPQTVLLALKDTKGILKISAAETAINMGLDVLLIVPFGLKGVAAATVAAYLFEKGALALYIKRKYGIDSGEYTDWPLYRRYAPVFIAVFFISMKLNAILSWSFLSR